MRQATIERKTAETEVKLTLGLDGSGRNAIGSGVPFFDHMLTLFARHALFDLELAASGDREVDAHHTVEDTGIALGQALSQALGDKAGIERFGAADVPMEDALARVAVDLSGRPALVYKVDYRQERTGDYEVVLTEEFLQAFSRQGAFNLHVEVPHGHNAHHVQEAIFKALGRALRQAVALNPREKGVPSTKGVL